MALYFPPTLITHIITLRAPKNLRVVDISRAIVHKKLLLPTTGHTDIDGAGGLDICIMQVSTLEPQFSAEPVNGKTPLEVHFTDQSTGTVIAWRWDFDNDGIIDSEAQHPVWTYETPGVYSVALEVSNGHYWNRIVREQCVEAFSAEAGSALQFNGETSCVICPASPSLNLTEAFTVEAWIYPTGWGELPNIGSGKVLYKNAFVVSLLDQYSASSQCLAISLSHGDTGVCSSYTPSHSIVLNEWQHVAVSFLSGSFLKVFIDGVEQPLSPAEHDLGSLTDHAEQALVIGNMPYLNATFQGAIDEVRVWNTARSADELGSYMNCYLNGNEPHLAGYWNMDEGGGTTIQDRSGNGNNATHTDATWIQGVPLSGSTQVSDDVARRSVPQRYSIVGNYPNPFNPRTTIRYYLSESGPVHVNIYDVTGKLVERLFSGMKQAGYHSLIWDAGQYTGHFSGSGIYICKLSTGGASDIHKMLFIK